MDDPIIEEMDESAVLNLVRRGQELWEPRWNLIGDWRRTRYGEENVLALIPEELRSTDYQHHDLTFDKACNDGASFLSASAPVFRVYPPKDSQRDKVDNIESVLTEMFKPGGVLDSEAGHDISFTVWNNQLENGSGIYKLYLKRNYPLGMPQLRFNHDLGPGEELSFEENPDYAPRSRTAEREERGTTKFRESGESLKQRRDRYLDNSFAWQWNTVDPRTYFEIEQDGVPIAQGEVNARPATILDKHGLSELKDEQRGFVYMGKAVPRGTDAAQPGATVHMVNTFELWTPNFGYFGFVAQTSDSENPANSAVYFSKEKSYRWVNATKRLPYFMARGLPTTHESIEMSLQGAFGPVLSETTKVNYLETMLFNASHRGTLPKYQLVPDPAFAQAQVPLNSQQVRIVDGEDLNEEDTPAGWTWEPINPGTPVDLQLDLANTRERMDKHALAAVLTGQGNDDASGAQISLRINAASRALSPHVRHHQIPYTEMAEMVLETSKRLQIPLKISSISQDDATTRMVRTLELKPSDIITTKVQAILDPALPVDKAANETRGMALTGTGSMAKQTAAERYWDVFDWQSERARMNEDYGFPILQESTMNIALEELKRMAPEIIAEALGQDPNQSAGPLSQSAGGDDTSGGGPGGAYGGGSAALGRGTPALSGGEGSGLARPTVETGGRRV